jgi:electron transfer flavoprotein beta subunit
MKILVPIKRVPDPYSRVKVNSAGTGIETLGLKFEINPFDEIAIEEAVRIHEAHGSEVVAITIGKQECEEQVRKALAMGADRAIHVLTDEEFDSLGIAKVLASACRRENPDIVLMGKQAIDDDNNQAGQMLAALLDVPQATFASKVEIDGTHLRVTRETDDGQETLAMAMPAVITTDLRLNEPRYVALPGIIKARSKPVETVTLDSLGVAAECRVRVVQMEPPPVRGAGKRVANVEELLGALKTEKGVL